MATAKVVQGKCDMCGMDKKVQSQHGKMVCYSCLPVRIGAKNNPSVAIAALREFGNLPSDSSSEEMSELQDTLDFVRRDLAKSIELNHMQKAKIDELELFIAKLQKSTVMDVAVVDVESCPVNHPSHYTSHPSGIECIQVTEHMGFCLGNAVKYIWRAALKGNAVEDLEKSRWYLDREIGRILGAYADPERYTETKRAE